jgi:hypothetical protein
MMSDDDPRRAFETLTGRLHDEIRRQVEAAMDELAKSAHAERDQAIAEQRDAHAAELATARSQRDSAAAERAELERTLAAEREKNEAALASMRAERDAAVAASVASPREGVAPDDTDLPGGSKALASTAAAVRQMAQANSLGGVLETLLAAAQENGATATVWLIRGQELVAWRSHRSPQPAPFGLDGDDPAANAARTRSTVSTESRFATPLTIAGEPVAIIDVSDLVRANAAADMYDVLALYASRSLEAITAFKTARALTRSADQAAGQRDAASSGAGSTSAAGQPSQDLRTGAAAASGHDDEHASAQRYARLLVSEIKLYHQNEVVEGQRDRDLATRLGGEIARARAMYEERVPAHVRQQADYFRQELVRTLANGDATLLEVRT